MGIWDIYGMLSVIKLHPTRAYSDDIPIKNHDVFLVNSRYLVKGPTSRQNQQVQVSGNQSVDQNHLRSKSKLLENAWGVATYDQKG
jgi:hypothetical protein